MSDPRGHYVVCPGCGGALLALAVEEEARVHVCRSCQGAWFDWFDGEMSALAQALAPAAAPPPPVPHAPACPRDGAPLVEQPYLDAGPPVERCPTCLGLFARRDRIEALRTFHLRMPEESPEPIQSPSLLTRIKQAFG